MENRLIFYIKNMQNKNNTENVHKEVTQNNTQTNLSKDKKGKKIYSSRFKLFCCIFFLVIVTLVTCIIIIAATWAGGWLKEYTCSTVLKDSYIWEKAGCKEEQSNEKSLEDIDKDNEWETYKNKEIGFTFKYPNDWSVENYADPDNPLEFHISVNKREGYNIDFTLYEGNYPYYCIYNDTDKSKLPKDISGNNKQFDNFIEVAGVNVEYRRSDFDIYGSQIEWIVCKKESSNLYNAFIDPVFISYRVPWLPSKELDQKQLETLDEILTSFLIINNK